MVQEDVIKVYRRRLPDLFAHALAGLERRAAAGDRGAKARLSDLVAEPVPVRVVFEGPGGGELLLSAGRSGLELADALPGAGFGHAFSIPSVAAHHGLTMLDRSELSLGEIAQGVALLGSRTAHGLFSATNFAYEFEVSAVPVLGAVCSRISLGRAVLPTKPEFKLTVHYDELADAREERVPPQQLFFAGKIKIDGDVAKAMQLGMALAQLS
jgi:hypothetical protein